MNKIQNLYGGKLRLRTCGICIENNKLLLVNHAGIGQEGELWIPPGGGVKFGESVEEALKREFNEECGLEIKVNELLFVNEFYQNPLHAIELFFKVSVLTGEIKIGQDPELAKEDQIIKNVKFVSFQEINELPNNKKHNILVGNISEKKLLNMSGYFKLWQ